MANEQLYQSESDNDKNKFNIQAQHRIVLLGFLVIYIYLIQAFVMLPLARAVLHGLLGSDLVVPGLWSQWSFIMPSGDQTIFIEPIFAFGWVDLYIGFILALLTTLFLPEYFGFMRVKVMREIDGVKKDIKAKTGFSDAELYQWYSWSNTDIEIEVERRKFQRVVGQEIIIGRAAENWARKGFIGKLMFPPAIRLYMTHHFTERYANMVQGAAYIGAANLIIFIGIRGIKFIPPERPSPILFALWVEFSMLVLLGVTLAFTEEEERADVMLKKLNESSEAQEKRLSALSEQSTMQTQALSSLVRIMSGVDTDEVSKSANDRARELLSRAMAEERVGTAVKNAAENALRDAYTRDK